MLQNVYQNYHNLKSINFYMKEKFLLWNQLWENDEKNVVIFMKISAQKNRKTGENQIDHQWCKL